VGSVLSAVVLVATVVGIVMALLVMPILLVWPRAWAQLVPRRWRSWFVHHAAGTTTGFTAALTLLVCLTMSPFVLGAGSEGRTVGQKAVAVALVCAIFGGLTAIAVARTLRIGITEWAVSSAPRVPDRHAWTPVRRVNRLSSVDGDARPALHRTDRKLRNAARWLGAAGVAWYALGRATQVGSGHAEAPGWWWAVTLLLLVSGAVVWVSRRLRWQAGDRRRPLRMTRQAGKVLHEHGLTVHTPAGPWAAGWARNVFRPEHAVAGKSLWPWAATGSLGDARLLVAAQHAQVRNQTMLAGAITRTACVLRAPGMALPQLAVSERESIPPAERHRSIALEFEAFNRALWVWGPQARGVYDLLHPRAMSHVIRHLPDGARLQVDGDTVAVVTDEPVSDVQLGHLVEFTCGFAELVPSYLRAGAAMSSG